MKLLFVALTLVPLLTSAQSAPEAAPRELRTPKPPAAPRINGPEVFGVRPEHPVLYHIPATGERHSLTQGSFWMFDDSRVRVETVSASLTITQPRDITLYARVFELLQQSAVYGREARLLIGRALRDLAAQPE